MEPETKLSKRLIRQTKLQEKQDKYSVKTKDFKNKQILYILYPIGVSSIDVSVASSAFKNLLQGIPTNVSEMPLIIISSVIIVLIELVLGQSEKNRRSFFPNLFITIIPIIALSEGIMRIGNYMELGEPWPYYVSTSLLFLGLSLLSYISHREGFLKAEDIVNSYNSTYYLVKLNIANKAFNKNEIKIKDLMSANNEDYSNSNFSKVNKEFEDIFKN